MTELSLMIGSNPILWVIVSIPLLVWLWEESNKN
mgnify:FL=1